MKLLFICTHNRCRSILAEAITNHSGNGLLEAASAGSEPAGKVHPLSLEGLQRHGISITGLRSKSWDDLETFEPDAVITVCDNAAGESCPVWMGNVPKVHWGLSDPSIAQGSKEAVAGEFDRTIAIIASRIRKLKWFLQEEGDPGKAVEYLRNLASAAK